MVDSSQAAPQPQERLYQLAPLIQPQIGLISLYARSTLQEAEKNEELRKQLGNEHLTNAQAIVAKCATAVVIPAVPDKREIRCSVCKQLMGVALGKKLNQEHADVDRLTCVKCMRRRLELSGKR